LHGSSLGTRKLLRVCAHSAEALDEPGVAGHVPQQLLECAGRDFRSAAAAVPRPQPQPAAQRRLQFPGVALFHPDGRPRPQPADRFAYLVDAGDHPDAPLRQPQHSAAPK
jgi:hypothetical protein